MLRAKGAVFMTTLKCSVSSCASNSSGGCCRPAIQVEGPGACQCAETSCQSYSPKPQGAPSNSGAQAQPNAALEIGCAAAGCLHNQSGRCSADCVCINRCANGTQCTSFEAR